MEQNSGPEPVKRARQGRERAPQSQSGRNDLRALEPRQSQVPMVRPTSRLSCHTSHEHEALPPGIDAVVNLS